MPKAARKPSAPSPRSPQTVPDVATLGAPSAGTTHFMVARKDPRGRQASLSAPAENGTRSKHIPIERLSLAFVRDTFGPGTYRLTWLCIDEKGSIAMLGRGNEFELEQLAPEEPDEPEEAPPAPAPAPKLRTSFSRRLYELQALNDLNRSHIECQVAERTAFIQAEAQRNREHQRELERIRARDARAMRERQEQAPAAAELDLSGLVEMAKPLLEKLEGAAAAGDAGALQQVGAVVQQVVKAPGVGKLLTAIARRLAPDLDDEDDDEDLDENPLDA